MKTIKKPEVLRGPLTRRALLGSGLIAGLGATYWLGSGSSVDAAASSVQETFEITKTEAEWRELLGANRFAILRKHGTERRWTSPLNQEKRAGIYHCAGCDLAVYDAATKFESGTGWPSFYQSLPYAVGTQEDASLFMVRTEVHCRRCGGHFGHVFNDGPAPTGKRHCINGLALTFKPA